MRSITIESDLLSVTLLDLGARLARIKFKNKDLANEFCKRDPTAIRRAWLTGAWEREKHVGDFDGPTINATTNGNRSATDGEYICDIRVLHISLMFSIVTHKMCITM